MIWFAAALVVVALATMASGRVPAVLVLAAALTVAGISGIATPAELFAGLSNGGVITVAAMLVIAKGIVQTGVVTRVTWALLSTVRTAQQAFRRLVLPVGVASSLINTTPIVAMLIPAARELEQSRGIPRREVLLPIAHVTTLAGSVTLIGTSSNLLIAGIAETNGITMSMLSFAAVALPVALVGWVVIYVISPLMLRGAPKVEEAPRSWRMEIPVSRRALALGRAPEDMGVARTQEYVLESIQRLGGDLDPTESIEAGDVLVFTATEAGVNALWGSPLFGLSPQRLYAVSLGAGESGTLRSLEEDGDVRVVAAQTTRPLGDTPVVPGATCFVTGASSEAVHGHSSFGLWQDVASRAPQPAKTWIAVAVLVGVIVAASFGLAPVELASLGGAVLMVLTGVVTPRSAVRALDWNVLFVLAGSVGLGAVVVSSGLADVIAEAIRYLSGGTVLLVVVVFVLITTTMTNLVTNAAAASVLTPVGIGIAAELGIDPVTLLALIGTCISFTFLNPFSHQSNLMVMRPGGYTSATFARFGVPLVLASVLAACVTGYLLLRA